MNEEEIKLFELLFPDDTLETWNITHLKDYTTKIGHYNVDELNKESNRLDNDILNIKDQTQELTITNYSKFIETAQCSRKLFGQFNAIHQKLDELLKDIPKFEKSCTIFGEETAGISNLRKLNSLTLTKNSQLLEILELPQLMNSFLNDELYEDALELAVYVRKLYSNHPDIPVFKMILDEVEKLWLIMLNQLLTKLREDLTLPNCLQIMGYLRRMSVFTETELRLKFLQMKNSFLKNYLENIPKNDVNHHLTKTIEVTRVNLFNIITQYRAIFNDDEHSPLATFKNDQINQNVLFYSWIEDKINEFLKVLKMDLDKSNVPVDTTLAQCMYFGLSFSKVGFDFRLLLLPIFNEKIMKNVTSHVDKARKNFESNMERFTLINKIHSNIPWKSKDMDDTLQPPESLLEFYPLADFLNTILESMNELRLTPSTAIINDIVKVLEDSLSFIAKSILKLYEQEHQAFTSNSSDSFTRLCMCFVDDLLPYIQKCIHIIYPPTYIANTLGITVQILQNENITFINKNYIVKPIQHLLPTKIANIPIE